MAEKVAIVLDRGAAARGIDDHGVEPLALHFAHPGGDIGAGRGPGGVLVAHVLGQGAATAGAPGDHDLAAVAAQQADCGFVDPGADDLLRTAGQQRHPQAAFAGGGKALRHVVRRRPAEAHTREAHDGAQAARHQTGEGPGEFAADQGQAKEAGFGQQPFQQAAQQPVAERPDIGLLDAPPALVQKMHVIDTRGAGRGARQAGQAAVDVPHRAGAGRLAALEHFLDQVDAAARAVQFVAQGDVGRAGRGAKAAMHAFAQNIVGLDDVGVGELIRGETGLHGQSAGPSAARRPGLNSACGSSAWRRRWLSAARVAGWG